MLEYRLVSKENFTDDHYELAAWIPKPNFDELDWDGYEYMNYLFLYSDEKPIRFIAADGGEPEDQTLTRDFSWVVDELNKALSE